ncbi:unnamed protein product [Nesidiocoris tenuis]|uniref:Uncharacterized protein n=1 Tax=Nesidiocoris tenuis TaxID=355587 RepID=A0A6H5GZR5_9HEMI|nr:unnamed protein product [Nesidiocoris tenuis]
MRVPSNYRVRRLMTSCFHLQTCEGGKTRWYCISDSHVDEVTEERVLKTPAYLLFYSRLPNGKSESCPRTSTTASTPP